MITKDFIQSMEERMGGEGQVKHGDFRKQDQAYCDDRIEHALKHLHDYQARKPCDGKPYWFHLSAVSCDVFIPWWHDTNRTEELLNDWADSDACNDLKDK
jgi:hypothetical protein